MQNIDWPTDFDFRTDELCQNIFKPFIEKQMDALKSYDQKRPDDVTYIFHEHAQRVAENVRKACLYMNLGETVAWNMYWAILPHDIGKTRLPADVWDIKNKPSERLKTARRRHTTLGIEIVEEELRNIHHPFKDLMIDIMRNHHEQMDGKGTHGVPGDQLSLPVRLASIIEAYDGWRIWRPHYGDRNISPDGVLDRMEDEKMHMFDLDLFEAFAEMKRKEYKAAS